MKERVTIRLGTSNVVLIAPHAHDLDDTNTNIIALTAADELDAHAVVNNGWKRSKQVDELKSEANCNDIDHCHEPVVCAEFLDPIISAIDDITQDDGSGVIMNNGTPAYIFMIHGIGNSVRTKANDPKLDLIVGFGAGSKPRYTCEQWRREAFMDLSGVKWKVYAGAAGGAYSARSSKNMTQVLHHETGEHVLQLEFIYSRRKDEATAKKTGESLAKIIKALLNFTSYTRPGNVTPPPEI